MVKNQSDEIDYELSDKELRIVNDAFDLNCPNDGEEVLTSENLKTALRSLGFEPRANEIKKLVTKFANKKGKINRDAFQRIMALKYSTSPATNDKSSDDEISKVFNLFDLDRTGKITFDNLRSIAKDLNEEITDEELREMISEADQDGDMLIDKVEFQAIMKKTSLY